MAQFHFHRHLSDLVNIDVSTNFIAPIRPPAELRPRPTPGRNHPRGGIGRRSPLATLPKRRQNNVKSKALAKVVLAAPCADTCAICMDTHKKVDSLMTECGHEFGRECWNSWVTSPATNSSCPACRKYCPKVTVFRARKPRKLSAPIPIA